MSGLRDAFDEIAGDVPVYGDLDRAIEQAESERRHRYAVVGGLAAAAAVLVVIAASLVLTRDGDPQRPIGPTTPTQVPTESTAPAVATDGSIYFAADARAGEALTDPLSHEEAEVHRKPTDIYLSRRGQPVRPIVATGKWEGCPRVSPDGDRLAYLEESRTIVVLPLDGAGDPGAPEARAQLPAPAVGCPQWSPDGRSVGYVVVLGDPDTPLYQTRPAEVHAMGLDGEDRVLASFETQVWHQPAFAWSPDGDEIAYTTEGGLWLAPLGGDEPELLWRPAEGDPTQELPMVYDRPVSVTWSSQREIAFTVYGSEPNEPNDPYGTGTEFRTVHVIDLGSRRVQQLATLPEGTVASTWSPDGSLLAFVGADGHIRVTDRVTGSTARLTPTIDGHPRVGFWDVGWSPDGHELLALAVTDASGLALVSIPLDGSATEVRTRWTWALDWTTLEDVDWSGR